MTDRWIPEEGRLRSVLQFLKDSQSCETQRRVLMVIIDRAFHFRSHFMVLSFVEIGKTQKNPDFNKKPNATPCLSNPSKSPQAKGPQRRN